MCMFGSRPGNQILELPAQVGSKRQVPSRSLASDDGMGGPSSGQASDERTSGNDGGRGGKHAAARPNSNPPSPARRVELYLWVSQVCSSLCLPFLQQNQGGKSEPRCHKAPQPRNSFAPADQGGNRRATKRGSGCRLEMEGRRSP